MGAKLLMLQIQVSIAVMVILVIRMGIRKLPGVYSYVLWILVFARLLIPVSLETRFSVLPSEEESTAWVEETLQAAGRFSQDTPQIPDTTDGTAYGPDMPGEKEAGAGMEDTAVYDMPETLKAAGSGGGEKEPARIPAVFLIVWALGTAGILGYNGFAVARIGKFLKGAVSVKESVYVCEGIHEPFTMGLFRAKIYLPRGLEDREREYIICHEKIHVRRKDYLVKNIAFLLTAVYWFNPFVWVAFLFLERDMEMSCDEKVIRLMGESIRRQYSQSLLNFAKRREHMPATPLTFGENNARQRIQNVLARKNTKWWGVGIGAGVLLAAGVILFTTGADGSRQPEGQLVPEMANQPGEPDTVAHSTPEETVENWANAFCSRYRNNLKELAFDKEVFESWDLANVETEGMITFGWVEPWAWSHEYDIQWTEENELAVIRYYMQSTDPGIRYVADERVRVREQEGLYYIEHEDIQLYDGIATKSEFETLYGREGSYDFGYRNTGWTDGSFKSLLLNMGEGGGYEAYRDPVTAAQALLHLGEGEGEITEETTLPFFYTVTPGEEKEEINPEESGLPGWLLASSKAAEGSSVTVAYTFKKDGSVIEIPMYLVEGSRGLWAPDPSYIRGWYSSRRFYSEAGGKQQDYYIQISRYGIYRLDEGGLRYLYAGYVPQEYAGILSVCDGKLYFAGDSRYQYTYTAGALDYRADSLFVLDMDTGSLDTETYRLPEEALSVMDNALWLHADDNSKFISLYSDSEDTYRVPIVNIREPVYNGKDIKSLSEEELQLYASANREAVLSHPDRLADFSLRDYEETDVYMDLDGDNTAEKIVLKANGQEEGIELPYDSYILQVEGQSIEGGGVDVNNGIWVYSPDGQRIILALYQDGPSNDPYTSLFEYADGSLRELGGFADDIRRCSIQDGTISGTMRMDVQQTDWIDVKWQVGEDKVELVEQETYEFRARNEITLLVNLPVHKAPGESSPSYMIEESQTVRFLRTDSTFSWIYAEGADGTGGWFRAGYFVPELKMDYFEVFDNLSFAD